MNNNTDTNEKTESIMVDVKPDSKILSDVSSSLTNYCSNNYLPILDNKKNDNLESLHKLLIKNFKKKEIRNIILDDFEDIGNIIN